MLDSTFFLEKFQGGVRRQVWIVLILTLVFTFPSFWLGGVLSKLLFQAPFSSANTKSGKSVVVPKVLTENSYALEETKTVDLLDGTRLLYTFINNKSNKNLGFSPFVYSLKVLDANQSLVEENIQKNYLLPADTGIILTTSTEPNAVNLNIVKDSKTIAKQYSPATNSIFAKPNLDIRDSFVAEKDVSTLYLHTAIKNVDRVIIGKVDLFLIIRGENDEILGIKTFNLNEISPNEERAIDLNYPKSVQGIAKNLDVRYFVNYLDPSSLRLP